MARLNILPEALGLEVLARLNGIGGPLAFGSELKELDGANEHRARWRAQVVFSAAEPKDNRAAAEQNRWQKECTPETYVLHVQVSLGLKFVVEWLGTSRGGKTRDDPPTL
jgi:hypothetical protein